MKTDEKKYRILLVEDEQHLRELILMNLEIEGYYVTTASNGLEALKVVESEKIDLVLLDIMLPEKDGFEVCEAIRINYRDLPILFISAKGNAEDKIQGLKLGGDDYLSKPFHLEELLLRVSKLLDRYHVSRNAEEIKTDDVYEFGGNTIYFDKQQAVNYKGEVIQLTKIEGRLLRLFIDNEGQAISRERILNAVWGYNIYPSTRSIDNFVLSFRKYFEKDMKQNKHFISLRGIGYRFEV
jgi:two-component system alkaline phosphatase synthesis response regulator PhoP